MKKYILTVIFLSLAIDCFSQYVGQFSGAWYNPNGIIYIVNPLESNRCEIAEIIIDNMFNVIQEPEIGIVYALDDTSWRVSDLEIINFKDRIVKVSDIIYAPTSGAVRIDIFGNPYLRGRDKLVIPQNNSILAKRIYIEDRIEVIKEGYTNEYFELINKLNGSRLVVFNNAENSYKYIFNDMELIDYGLRIGEGDEIIMELYNENEAVVKCEC
jgi:hypothetical protein